MRYVKINGMSQADEQQGPGVKTELVARKAKTS